MVGRHTSLSPEGKRRGTKLDEIDKRDSQSSSTAVDAGEGIVAAAAEEEEEEEAAAAAGNEDETTLSSISSGTSTLLNSAAADTDTGSFVSAVTCKSNDKSVSWAAAAAADADRATIREILIKRWAADCMRCAYVTASA
jgi:hypothetical protein